MAEKLLTDVRSVTRLSVTEAGESFDAYFNNETEITATATISEGEFDFCVDEKRKIVYGIYWIDRKRSAATSLIDCENRMLRLNDELQSYANVSDAGDPETYRSIRDRIKKDSRIVIYLDPTADMAKLNSQFGKFERHINRLKDTSDQEKFNELYRSAELRLRDKDFPTGIRALQSLKLDYPQRKEILELLEVSSRRYARHMEQTLGTYMAQRNYALALNTIDEYCDVLECTTADLKLSAEICKAYFNESFEKFDSALKAGQKSNSVKHLEELRMLAATDPKRYRQADDRFTQFLLEEEMHDVEQELARENFLVAQLKVKIIEERYGSSSGELQSLKKNTEQKLLQNEVRKERQTRPMLFSFVMGLEAVTNQVDDIYNVQEQVRTFTMGYSAGLYKKFNHQSAIGRSGYSRMSDQIGVKVRLTDFQTTLAIAPEELPATAQAGRYGAELLLDGYLLRSFHFAGGVVFPNMVVPDKAIYTFEFGIRLPFGPLSLQSNARVLYLDSKPEMMLTGGIFYQIDFWRTFGAKDRKQIKFKLGM